MGSADFSATSESSSIVSSTKPTDHSMKIKLKIAHHDRLEEEDYQVYGGPRVDQTAELRLCDFCGKSFSSGKALGGHRRIHFQHQDGRPVTKPKPSSDRRTAKKFQHEIDCSDHRSGSSSSVSDGHESATNLLTFLTGWSRTDRRGKRSANQEREDEDNSENVLNLDPNRDSDYTVVPFKKRKIEHQINNPHSSSVSEKRFNCRTCDKSFPSFQALGGHTSSHFKAKIHHKSKDEQREHRCKICHKTFTSGQALGGHQRRHWVGPSSPAFGSDEVAAPIVATLDRNLLFDLNELPLLEE